jgi:hypothetical protein
MIKTKAKKSTALVPAGANGKGGQEELPSALHLILEEMAKRFAEIDSLTHKTCRELVRVWYDVGLRVAEVQKHEAKYGANAVNCLAEELSARRGRTVRDDELYQAKAVTDIYAWSYIEKLFAKADKANVEIFWGHFSRGLGLLKKLKDTAFRKKCEAQLIEEQMSVEDLCRVIRDFRNKSGAPRSGAHRRPSISPRSAGAACKQIRKYSSEFADRLDGWDHSLFDWVTGEAAPEELSDELLEDLQETQSDVAEMGKTCEEVGGKLEKAIARVNKVMGQRKELAEATGGKRTKKGSHEDEDVEVEPSEDEDVEVEPSEDDDVEVEEPAAKKNAHKSNGKASGKPLSVKERIARAKAKEGR